MSKIAEKIHDAALKKGEEYSKSHGGSIIEEVTYGRGYKSGYIEGYDQAMKDFMEKAEKVFNELYLPKIKFELFKQYMENEYFPSKENDTSTIIERNTK